MIESGGKYNKRICAISDFAELNRIRKFVVDQAVDFGFSEEESLKISLAVDEACTNLIEHSYKHDKNKQFFIQIDTGMNNFTVSILDDGKPFNPTYVKPPNMNEYLKKYKRGGLGIHIMRKVMDEISYFPSGDTNKKNVLKLKKTL
jgi:serine/threonine-protein kinase RsbW